MSYKKDVKLEGEGNGSVIVSVTYEWFTEQKESKDRTDPPRTPQVDSITNITHEGVDITSFALEMFKDEITQKVEDNHDNPDFY